ncbi:acyl-CoA thioesterase [Alicycliphilus denitrificans]|uniref:acyl-CoA thioesterase n=1 Tax=Alicycliphilus denitrificans TaxID=179636 RepID=UPI0001DA0B1D|nr:thioesterase family protein [Alicycliphilus denitrificans]ADV00690.1 hypothetical protein Alide_2963 [Alicycliphilus denitrificans BC]GAO24193.1 hypothetical protein ALISP_4013 [Alicycliphilus sp. B1]
MRPNGHWNTRFYTRAFPYASETVALLGGNGNPGAATIGSRHIRFQHASYDHHVSLGYSPQFIAQTGVGRMVVEMRTTWLGQASAGMGIRSNSWLVHAQGKSFSTAHRLETLSGTPIALVELCLVAVDMQSRRATHMPDFLPAQARAGANTPENIAGSA